MSLQDFERSGYCILPKLLGDAQCELILEHLPDVTVQAGCRSLLALPVFRSLAQRLMSLPELAVLMPASHVPVQCTLFVKSPGLNWAVAPHQDLSIPVAARVAAEGCSGWSQKEGVHFVQPPSQVLQSLVAVRLQLDVGSARTGPLQVIPASHRRARLDQKQLARLVSSSASIPCVVPRGGALIMRPLLVHGSAKAVSSGCRRVLHFLFGPPDLPQGLQWAYTHPQHEHAVLAR